MSLPQIGKAPQQVPVKIIKKPVNRVSSEQLRKDNQVSEEKLGEQFRYFFREYMEAATSSQVTVPLDLIEDKPGFLFTFVKNGGPKHLLEVIRTSIENVHVLRCAISLLIITITILRRKLPEHYGSFNNSHNVGHLSSMVPEAITSWTLDALAKVCDGSAVSVCIAVLIGISNPNVQELALSLLTSVLAVSDNAIMQMLKVPNSRSVSSDVSGFGSKRNGSSSNVTLEDLAMLTESPKKAKSDSIDFSKFNFKYNPTDYSHKKERPKKTQRPENYSCLSYVLSVAMVQKNRHLLTAGCADIILVMCRVNTREMCEAIAQTPTCPLPLVADLKNAATNSGGNNKAAGGAKPTYSLTSGPGAGSKTPTNPLSANLIEWAGLKIMLKFLFRYQQITNQYRGDSIMRDSVSASLHLREELLYAHSKVFGAVCALIGGSSLVAEYTNTLPGAEQLMQLAAQVHAANSPDHAGDDDVNISNCLGALARDREEKQLAKEQAEEIKLQQMLAASADPLGRKIRTASPGKRHRGAGGGGDPVVMKMIGSNIRKDTHSAKIALSATIEVDFKGQYDVEQEQGKLYLINTVDGTYEGQAPNAVKAQLKGIDTKRVATTGLSYQPQNDRLLDSSLEAIDFATAKINATPDDPNALQPHSAVSPHLLPPRPSTKHHQGGSHGHNPMYDQLDALDDSQPHHHSSNESRDSKSRSSASFLYQKQAANVSLTGAIEVVDTEAMLKNHKFNAKTDFFDNLPRVPTIPTRIEPKTVISPDEEMEAIRQKFQQLADRAVKQISDGVGFMRNGKGSISLEEKARRVYSPAKGGLEAHLASMGFDTSKSVKSGSKPGSRGTTMGSTDLGSTGRFASFRDEAGNTNVRRSFSPALDAEEVEDFHLDPANAKTVQWNSAYGNYDPDSSAASGAPSSPSIYGLKLENVDFDGQDLFDGFTPLFDLPVRPLTTAANPRVGSASVPPEGQTDSKKQPPRKLKVEMMQSLDIITQ